MTHLKYKQLYLFILTIFRNSKNKLWDTGKLNNIPVWSNIYFPNRSLYVFIVAMSMYCAYMSVIAVSHMLYRMKTNYFSLQLVYCKGPDSGEDLQDYNGVTADKNAVHSFTPNNTNLFTRTSCDVVLKLYVKRVSCKIDMNLN